MITCGATADAAPADFGADFRADFGDSFGPAAGMDAFSAKAPTGVAAPAESAGVIDFASGASFLASLLDD